MSTTVADAPQRGFFGHPRGLQTLFFTEMWERFSYYGMRAILAYYLYAAVSEGGLGIPQSTALAVVSGYGASVYMSGILGGWLADRLIGSQRSVFHGGLIIMLGHVCLALPGGLTTLLLGMFLLVLGSGLLKPNISNIVGGLYGDHDTRRDAGFSLFYMGINIGAFIAPLVCGWLGEKVNWHAGFGAAAVGMAFGLIQYVLTRKNLGTSGLHPVNPLPAERTKSMLGRVVGIVVLLVAVLGGLAATGVLDLNGLVDLISVLSAVLPIGYFAVILSSKQITRTERQRMVAYIPLFLATALFFLLFEQQPNTLATLAKEDTQLGFFGLFHIPASWFQSVNALSIIVLAPVFAALWVKMGDRQPNTPQKFVGGLAFVGIAFLWVVLSKTAAGSGDHFALMLAAVFVIMTIGELMLSPVGMSVTTKLAPAAFSSQAMALYFLAPAMGQGLGAQVVSYFTVENQQAYFGFIGAATVACAVLLLIASRTIKRYMHGVL